MRDIKKINSEKAFPFVEVTIARGNQFQIRNGTFRKDFGKNVFFPHTKQWKTRIDYLAEY